MPLITSHDLPLTRWSMFRGDNWKPLPRGTCCGEIRTYKVQVKQLLVSPLLRFVSATDNGLPEGGTHIMSHFLPVFVVETLGAADCAITPAGSSGPEKGFCDVNRARC